MSGEAVSHARLTPSGALRKVLKNGLLCVASACCVSPKKDIVSC